MIFIDESARKEWSVRNDIIHFPIISSINELKLIYTRTYGIPQIIVLILFLDGTFQAFLLFLFLALIFCSFIGFFSYFMLKVCIRYWKCV